MASNIKIKRSEISGNPAVLGAGELAYSGLVDNGVNGGDRLYVGMGTETNGNAVNHVIIGGKYFTDKLDHTLGTLTANSAILVDADSKIDVLNVDNLRLDGNTLSSTNINGDINIVPAGAGKTVISNLYIGSDSIQEYIEDISGGQIIAGESIDVTYSDNDGTTTIAAKIATTTTRGVASFSTDDFSLTTGAVDLKDTVIKSVTTDSGALTPSSHGISILGGEGINVTHAGTVITVTGELATSSNEGVASFNSDDFVVTTGAVSIKAGGVSNAQLVNDSVTFGSTEVVLGGTSTAIAGVTQLDVDNLNFNGNEITATNTNGSIVLNPNGTGSIEVSGAKITGLGAPTQSTDATTKEYVDSVAEGLSVKPAVRVGTTGNISATYNNGASGVGSTLTIAPAATLLIDGISDWSRYDGILVKDQVNAFENGRYYVDVVGDASTSWVLIRCPACDQATEIPSMYVFIQEGTNNGATGWVAQVEDPAAFDVGIDDIIFIQFSGAGTYLPGDGLEIDGTTFNVLLSSTGGLELAGGNSIGLKAGVGGNGLINTDGVINVIGTTDRISVSADAIDIASTYVGQTSITTLGTITTGTWNATVLSGQFGGTGVVNTGKTITLGGNLTTSGSFTTNITSTANTAVTLPTTGTLATLAGDEALSNKTITNSSIGSANPSTAAFTSLTASGLITFTNSTEASSASVASVVFSGGLGIAKDIRLSGDLIGSGASTSLIDGFTIDGGTY